MKTIEIADLTLDACVQEAQEDRVLVTSGGRPVAIVVGVAALDDEQIQLSSNDAFWKLISSRRKQPTLSREELERRLDARAD
jgi:antitoxin (DNA-binding transcriptional repressor) of toxin-antitoxin stability system